VLVEKLEHRKTLTIYETSVLRQFNPNPAVTSVQILKEKKLFFPYYLLNIHRSVFVIVIVIVIIVLLLLSLSSLIKKGK
jgi:hypothetical protein